MTDDHGEAFALSLDAMQLDHPSKMTLNDLPDDLLRLIVSRLSDTDQWGRGRGGMNAVGLVSKRLMQVVESCATTLSDLKSPHSHDLQEDLGPKSLPRCLMRCARIERIKCYSRNLNSLNRCPEGLKSLSASGHSLESLEPLQKCRALESLDIRWAGQISDLSPLASCVMMKLFFLHGTPISVLSPLSLMPLLENLSIYHCKNIKSLDPLSGLMNLKKLDCIGIHPQTSLLPLVSCTGLKELRCDRNAVNVEDLQAVKGLMVRTY
jgi:Leucine-rich repeat (LRR) protein